MWLWVSLAKARAGKPSELISTRSKRRQARLVAAILSQWAGVFGAGIAIAICWYGSLASQRERARDDPNRQTAAREEGTAVALALSARVRQVQRIHHPRLPGQPCVVVAVVHTGTLPRLLPPPHRPTAPPAACRRRQSLVLQQQAPSSLPPACSITSSRPPPKREATHRCLHTAPSLRVRPGDSARPRPGTRNLS